MNDMEPKVLITGTGRGLGKFLYSEFSKKDIIVESFTRKDNVKEFIEKLHFTINQSYDMIIHCAANVSHMSWEDEIPYSYYYDNVFLTQEILKIPHKRFIYISSIDQQKQSPYGVCKKISESIVKEKGINHLIIRPTGLLGKEMKKNTFQKLIKGEPIALTPDSVMNYVLYDDVLEAIYSKSMGTMTLCADGEITMKEISDLVKKETKYGDIYFNIESSKFTPTLKYTSKENIIRYLEKYEK